MARDRNDKLVLSKPDPTSDHPGTPLGQWNGGHFAFTSPQHEREWQSQAYRQSVRADNWHAQAPVDQQTQAMLDGMPEVGAGQYFRGPDRKYRRITMEQREVPAVQQIRRQAFGDFAKTGVTWNQLATYDNAEPHPGEEVAIALTTPKVETKAAAGVTWPNKTRDMGDQPTERADITRVAGDLDLDLGQNKDPWTGAPTATSSAPIQVAGPDWSGAVAVSTAKGQVETPAGGGSKKSIGSSRTNRAFVERLIGPAANDNAKVAANSNVAAAQANGKVPGQDTQPSMPLSPKGGGGMSAEEIAEAEYSTGLFNWQRQGKPAPAPKAFAIHAVSDEGRFSYLEEAKDEWSSLVEANPERVFNSMVGEVEKLSNAAQQAFFTSYHREANAQELAEINDAVEKVVFAPAEHWAEPSKGPDERGGEVRSKPYIALDRPEVVSGAQLADALDEVAVNIAQEPQQKTGGRPGSDSSRNAAALIAQKLAAAIKACGGDVTAELFGPKEPQIQRIHRQVKDSRYPDVGVPFKINGRDVGAFVSHFTPAADGITMNLREAIQWDGLIENISRAIVRGELGIDAAGVGAVPKQSEGQTEEEYLKMIDDLIKDMIDCRRPFLIKLDINPKKIPRKIQ